MASPEWQEIYRTYTDAELATEVAALKQQATNLGSQTVGSQSLTADLAEVRNRLHAAIRVQNERSRPPCLNPDVGFADFSKGLS